MSERLRVGLDVWSPKYSEGIIMDLECEVKTRPWIHKTMVGVLYVSWLTDDHLSSPSKMEFHYHRLKTVEKYRRLWRERKRGE